MARLEFPAWLPLEKRTDQRFGIGCEFTCPHCDERLRVYFVNPCDGFRSLAPIGAQLYRREGSGLGTLSLAPEVDAGEHGCFEIIRGEILYRMH
jgi:hypothetical protein